MYKKSKVILPLVKHTDQVIYNSLPEYGPTYSNKSLICGTKHVKDQQLQNLKHPCRFSYMGM